MSEERRIQKNITITPEQVEFARLNYGKMTNAALAKMLGVGYNKTLNNLRIMKLYTPKPYEGKVIEMKGYFFDVDMFGKFYEY